MSKLMDAQQLEQAARELRAAVGLENRETSDGE
jgi:hypothetical protein